MDKVITFYKGKSQEAQLVAHNASRLVQTVALLVCAYYNYASTQHAHISSAEYRVRWASSVVLAITGSYLLLCHLAQKEIK